MAESTYDSYAAPSGDGRQEHVMPQDIAAEKSILSAMLLSQEVLQECLVALNEDDFYLYSHKAIFRAMNELFDRGQVVDPVSLADHLRSTGNLDRVGGMAYILDLNTNSFSLASWQHHVEILHRDATLRAIIEAASKITALAFDAPEDTKEVVDSAENLLLGVTNREIGDSYSTLTDVMGDLYNELSEMSQNPQGMIGVSTGYPGIDASLQGLRPGQMVVVGARPGVGKTSFALNLAVNAAAAGASVAFFSLEMSKAEIAQRLLSAQAKIPLSAIRGGNIKDDQWPTILDATRDLSQLDIMIDDTPGTTVTEIRAKARRMLKDKPKGMVMVDYLQLLSPPAGGHRADSRATEVSEMSRGIKIMAKDLEVPVVALSQLNRQVTDRKGQRPQLSDLRESGSIEQDADIVILLDRSMTEEEAARDDRPDMNVTEFIIAKNRSGPLNIVPLMFLPGSTKFVEVDTRHME
ncbi:MAG: replicative DNA helicase [Coriobacteriaceae bacterium]|jgi:replicative DNA helicase|nr:replicative DNA helicase [Olsenella sp.]MCI1288939.1 replicative DNA helicase [Olsenella sp.]RRF90284.1 MAG: replicative DNA helicase [Coriobacteriaceae bacterium]